MEYFYSTGQYSTLTASLGPSKDNKTISSQHLKRSPKKEVITCLFGVKCKNNGHVDRLFLGPHQSLTRVSASPFAHFDSISVSVMSVHKAPKSTFGLHLDLLYSVAP